MDEKLLDLVNQAKKYEKELPSKPKVEVLVKSLSSYLDCALHNAEATPAMIEKLCAEAVENKYATVFVNPVFVPMVKQHLAGSAVNVGTVAGFPLGGFPTHIKVAEARAYVEAGANEIDMVMLVGLLKAGAYQQVYDDILAVVQTVHALGGIVKVILETAVLTRYEKIIACLISKAAGADFVKTSTGFSKGGATVEDIDLMRRVVGPTSEMGVKAAGGIHTLNEAMAMIEAGADRLGTRMAAEILGEHQHQG